MRYLDDTLTAEHIRYRVGGHSKGGNLAVYGSMMCRRNDLILEIYSNDGLGLCPDVVNPSRYDEIRAQIRRIVPEFSVVSAFYEQEPPTMVVTSSLTGISQHDGMSWEVENDRFCRVHDRCASCQTYNQILKQWLDSTTIEQRKAFAKDFFDALERGGSKQMSRLSRGGWKEWNLVLFSLFHAKKDAKLVLVKFLRACFSALKSPLFWNWGRKASIFLERKGKRQGISP